MTKACKKGDVRAMISIRIPGVGKSYGVETVLDRYGVVSSHLETQNPNMKL